MHEELVKTVRLCVEQPCCDNCPRYDNGLDPEECTKKLMLDCAEAIDNLQTDCEEKETTIKQLSKIANDDSYRQGEWDMFQSIVKAQYGKQRFVLEGGSRNDIHDAVEGGYLPTPECAYIRYYGEIADLQNENERLASKVEEQKKYISSLVETMMILDKDNE